MNKSLMFAAIACVGVICTGILCAKSAIEIKEETDGEEPDISTEEETIVKKAISFTKKYWKKMIAPILALSITITSICISQGVSRKLIASLAGATGASSALLNKYKNEIREKFGESEYADIVRRIAKKEEEKSHKEETAEPLQITCGAFGGSKLEIPVSSETLFYDEWSNRWFRSNLASVYAAISSMERDINIGPSVSVDHFYELQGMTGEFGNNIGWNSYKLIEDYEFVWIDISVYASEEQNKNGENYYIISYDIPPYDLESDY